MQRLPRQRLPLQCLLIQDSPGVEALASLIWQTFVPFPSEMNGSLNVHRHRTATKQD